MPFTFSERANTLVRKLFIDTAHERGADFFRVLVSEMGTLFEVDGVYLAQRKDQGGFQVLAAWEDGGPSCLTEYSEEDTPCSMLYSRGPFAISSELITQFPNDVHLKTFGASSYIGAPMFDHQGKAIGHLCALSRNPLADEHLFLLIMQIFSARASAELERLQAGERLKEEQRRLQTLVSNLPGMVYRSLINAKWTKEYISDGCLSLTGYSADSFLNEQVSFADLIDEQHRHRNYQEVLKAVAEKRVFRYEFLIHTRDGTPKWVWEQGVPIFDDDGKAVAIEGYITDVTELVKAREELEANRKNLEKLVESRTKDLKERNDQLKLEIEERSQAEAELVASKEFANSAIHNIRNVLNSINVAAYQISTVMDSSKIDVLERCCALIMDNEPLRRSFETSMPKAEILFEALNQLAPILKREHERVLSEITSLKRSVQLIGDIAASQQSLAREVIDEEVDLVSIIQDALRIQLLAGVGETIQLKSDLPKRAMVRAPSSKVGHLVMNLVKNAKEALLQNQLDNRCLEVGLVQDEHVWCLTIRDNGIGIESGDLERLFTYGFTTKADGHGFGLHYCARIARDLGGDLAASSSGKGTGALFTLKIPVTE